MTIYRDGDQYIYGHLSVSEARTDSGRLQIGAGAGANADFCTAVGSGADAGFTTYTYCTALGYNADAVGGDDIAVGAVSISQASGGIAIGRSASVGSGHTDAVAIGRLAATTAADRMTVGQVGGVVKDLQVSRGFAAFGVAPPTTQPALISDPTGGTTQDAEARSAINAVLGILAGAGLMSST